MKKISNYKYYGYGVLLSLIISCGTSKIPEGDLLYTGADIKVEADSIPKKEEKKIRSIMEDKVRPKPNSSFLGLRPKVFFYNIAGEPKRNKGFRYWLRNKAGEPPVLFSQVDRSYNAEVMQSYLQNIGYFNAMIRTDSVRNGKKGKAIYTAIPKKVFRLNEVSYLMDDSPAGIAMDTMQSSSLLKKGKNFDLNTIIAERNRMDATLKEKGFYYFNPDYLISIADTTLSSNKVNLKLKIKEETPKKALQAYQINEVYIYPNYNLNEMPTRASKDSLYQSKWGFRIIDPENRFKPFVFENSMFFRKGELYNRTNHNLALKRLMNLGVFKFVKNEFKTSPAGENLLDVYYYLTPNEPKSIYFETLAKSNSASYYGTELSLNWSHLNVFKGAEKFNFKLYGGLDFQMGGKDEGFNIYQVGAETSLTFPRFVTPFRLNTSGFYVPKTQAKFGYSYMLRQKLYGLHSFNASWGYIWKENIRKEHSLELLDINYVHSENISELYRKEMEKNPSLASVVEQQLIFGPTYSFTYTNSMLSQPVTMYYKGELDLSANATGLILGANAEEDKIKKIAGVPFNQYAKISQDLRFYFRLGEHSEIATRLLAGIAYPYGNSLTVPHSRQFYIGGTNSIRAFHSRSLGPGASNQQRDGQFLYDRSGDIKLEANLEYRMKLFSVVNGALFADAGNIWLLNDTKEFPKGKFTKDFADDIAIGVGTGLRFDITFLILRLDVTFPIRTPYTDNPNKWVFKDIQLGNSQWRKDNLIFNIAIGYPF